MRRISWLAVGFVLSLFSPNPAIAAEADYYSNLFRRPAANVEDAVRLAARYKGYTAADDMRSELAFLAEHGVRFRPDILGIRGRALTAGNAAHLMLNATGQKGGVMGWIFPSSQRYALRQAIHLGLMPDDIAPEDVLSGSDLIGFVSKLMQSAEGKRP